MIVSATMYGASNGSSIPDGFAGDLARGVMRHFDDLGQACLAELPLGNGRRVDVIALDRGGRLTIIEIKSSRADYRADSKWQEYLPYCDAFFFAVAGDFDRAVMPGGVGIMVADRYGAAIVTPSPEFRMAAGRRKALTLRFARTAARRLMWAEGA